MLKYLTNLDVSVFYIVRPNTNCINLKKENHNWLFDNIVKD